MKLLKFINTYVSILCISCVNIISAQVPAFPCAEGFGTNTVGGREGRVISVINTNDSGSGSLREAVETNEPRIIVFKTSGTIALESSLDITYPYCTIAGQTAPGEGITLKNKQLNIKADHVIVRYIRSRLGDRGEEDHDAITISGGSNIIIDHCSASWSIDETLSNQSGEVDSITVQWCMVTESLNNSHHEKGVHGYGGIIGALNQTFHHNLYAHHTARNPKVTWRRPLLVDFRNNVIYNWGVLNSCHDGSDAYMNWVANYYKYGPATWIPIRDRIFILYDDYGENKVRASKLYAEGNYVWEYPDVTADNWNGGIDFAYGATEEENRVYVPFECPPIIEHTAEEAYTQVLEQVGASLARDPIDTRNVHEVKNGIATYGKNGIIDSQEDVGGWPTLYSLPAPMDSDNDGMPDYWEEQYGFNKNDPIDNNADSDGDVYENIEEYINNTDPIGSNLPIVYAGVLDSRVYEEDWKPGEFTLYRTGNPADSLSVNYTITGTATAEIDYPELSGTVAFETGQTSVKIAITPFQDTEDENLESVILTLNSGESTYHVGCPNASLIGIFDASSPVGIDNDSKQFASKQFELEQNFPNPFNQSTTISYSIKKSTWVRLRIFDLLGREVKLLVDACQSAKEYSVNFDASGLTSGIYCYQLQIGNEFVETKKLLLLK